MICLPTREHLLRIVPKGAKIAELGVFTGAFSSDISRICQPAELHLIDTWEGRAECGDANGENIQVVEDMSLVYLALALKSYQRFTLHRGTVQEMLAQFEDNYFDFVYVDATHTEEAVYADLRLAGLKTSWGIGGHDYSPQYPGVISAVRKFCQESCWRMTHITRDGLPSYLLRPVG